MKYLLDKISKQTLFFVSLIGIVVVSLIMVTTFAYQTLQVEYTSDSKKNLTVNAGVLDVSFVVTNRINDNNIPFLDDYKTANYSEFTVDNTKSSEDAAYKIKLVDLEYSIPLKTSVFKYTIVKVNGNGLEIISEGDFSELSGTEIELSDYRTIEKTSTEKLRLYLWIKNSNENQSNLRNSSFKGIIQVESMFDTETPTLKNVILRNAKNATGDRTVYQETPTTIPGQAMSTETERTLSKTADDYGDSYYFRGNVIDNFVTYAGMCWRIVRIEGDGSIKMILASEKICNDTNVTTSSGYATDSNEKRISTTYGYKTIDSKTKNDYIKSEGTTSNARTRLNEWLERKIINNTDVSKSDKELLKNDNWCIGDRTTAYDITTYEKKEETAEELINSGTSFYYNSGKRISNLKTPTLICDGNINNDGEIDKNTIGLLTVDETVFAGGESAGGTTYYLNKNASSNHWPILSLTYFNNNTDYSYYIYNTGYLAFDNVKVYLALRPVITLKENTEITAGDGTVNNAYQIK